MLRTHAALAAGLAFVAITGSGWAQDRPGEGASTRPQREARAPDDAPKVGDEAPLFTLKSLDGTEETDLASFRDQRPVILFFGSYT